jgi:8-oxo-dGTP diphosphatase
MTLQVTAALIIENNQVFAAKRSKGRHLAGYWEFPGGKIEVDETAQACLQRELLEELNIDATIGSLLMVTEHQYTDKKVALHVYWVNTFSGEIQLKDHDDATWLTVSDLDKLMWAPADMPIVKKLKQILGSH